MSELSIKYKVDGGIVEVGKTSTIPIAKPVPTIIYKQESIESVLQRLFGKHIEEYNSKQKRADRKKSIVKLAQSPRCKPFREVSVQLETDCVELSNFVLAEYVHTFEERNPNLKIFNAEMYLYSRPRLYIDFVPVCKNEPTRYTGSMPILISFAGALKEQGFRSINAKVTEQVAWAKSEEKYISALIKQYNRKFKN